MKDRPVVVRFAPSPTGMFHVGSARTALFNSMWSRAAGGRFLLRIEDTDSTRSSTESTDAILSAMTRLGLDWDGDVYHASAHRADHLAGARALVGAGLAYYCTCTRDDIDARGTRVGSGYDNWCRDRGLGPDGALVRLRNPGGIVVFTDHVLGENTTDADTFGDFPLVKSNGDPLFLLGNVLDDAAMGVTWVVRGADHFPNHPKYVLVWNALRTAGVFDADLPDSAHLPLIMGPSGKKLSKRRDKVDVNHYIDDLGILPSALLTYLSGLGWGAPDGHDKDTIDALVPHFDVNDVGVTNSVLDPVKMAAVNAAHLSALHDTDPIAFARAVTDALGVDWDLAAHPDLLGDLPSRISTFNDARAMLAPVFSDVTPDDKSVAKWLTGNALARTLLSDFRNRLVDCTWSTDALHGAGSALAADHGLGMMKATMPIRVAVLRSATGMPLFSALSAMDRGEVLRRIDAFLAD